MISLRVNFAVLCSAGQIEVVSILDSFIHIEEVDHIIVLYLAFLTFPQEWRQNSYGIVSVHGELYLIGTWASSTHSIACFIRL